MDTKMEYEIVLVMKKESYGDPRLQMKDHVNMADYHFRRNVDQFGVDPLTVITRIDWGDGTCRFVIEAPATEEVLSTAFDSAIGLIGLRAERC
jgi:hypothetical protein